LFSIVERSNNYVSGDEMTPYSPWKRVLSYKTNPLFYLLLESLHAFSGGKGRMNFMLRGFCMGRIFYGKGRFQRVKISGEFLRWFNLPEFLHKSRLYAWLSLRRFNCMRGNVNGNCSG